MDYHYRFWHSLFNPSKFAYALENQEKGNPMRGYRLRVGVVFFLIILFYLVRDLWGIGTEDMTYLFVSQFHAEYVLNRYLSAIGAAIYGIVFFLLHYFIISGCLAIMTETPYQVVKKTQLFVLTGLFVEKVFIFFIDVMLGYSTELSFLSFGPITASIIDESFFIYFFDALSIGTILMIAIQYWYLLKWNRNKKKLLVKIIFVYFLFIFLEASYRLLPLKDYFEKVVG